MRYSIKKKSVKTSKHRETNRRQSVFWPNKFLRVFVWMIDNFELIMSVRILVIASKKAIIDNSRCARSAGMGQLLKIACYGVLLWCNFQFVLMINYNLNIFIYSSSKKMIMMLGQFFISLFCNSNSLWLEYLDKI